MSAFLGPVHIKMYERILYQDKMSEGFLMLAGDKGWDIGDAEKKYPAAQKQPLEEIIDKGNIHGWLSVAVKTCEQRFDYIAKMILKDHPERLKELKGVMEHMGSDYKHETFANAEAAFAGIHDILLDGMPCDFPFQVVEESAGEVKWQVVKCPHGSDDTYYQLRDSWVDGALNNNGIIHLRSEDGTHILRKRA